jgi:hypothetical protein
MLSGFFIVMLGFNMLNGILLSVIMLIVVAPLDQKAFFCVAACQIS